MPITDTPDCQLFFLKPKEVEGLFEVKVDSKAGKGMRERKGLYKGIERMSNFLNL
jgi:hypothetical protein